MSILMGLDPGGTTGCAVKVANRYMTTTFTLAQDLWDFISEHKPDHIAFEVFTTAGRIDTAMSHTLELVGSLRGICYVLGIPGHGQMPQARRAFLEEAERIVKRNKSMYGTPFTKHEIDATAHLLLLEWRIKEGKL